jgi:ATP-binding cassette, subfamily B (MDR/TAP), member 1
MSHGSVIEQGTHNELLEKRSIYYELVEKQRMSTERSLVISEAKSALQGNPDPLNSKEFEKEFDRESDDVEPSNGAERESEREAGDNQCSLWELIKFVASLNKEETLIMVSGLFWSIITGAGNPT